MTGHAPPASVSHTDMIELCVSTNAQEAQSPECYICAETVPAPWPSDCACTDRFVHRDCLLQLLKTAPNQAAVPKCTVCTAPYGNVTTVEVRKCVLCNTVVSVWIWICAEIVMVGCFINVTFQAVNADTEYGSKSSYARLVLRAAAVSFFVVCALLLVVIVILVRRVGFFRFCRSCLQVSTEYRVHQPSPRPRLAVASAAPV